MRKGAFDFVQSSQISFCMKFVEAFMDDIALVLNPGGGVALSFVFRVLSHLTFLFWPFRLFSLFSTKIAGVKGTTKSRPKATL